MAGNKRSTRNKRKQESIPYEDVSMASTDGKVSLKLLIDKTGRRVLFAEAGKEFIDFLIHIFSMPLGTVVDFLSNEMMGCLGKLKASIKNLNDNYLQPNLKKQTFLNPKTFSQTSPTVLLLSYDTDGTTGDVSNHASSSATRNFYKCNYPQYGNCHSYVTEDPSTRCPSCKSLMDSLMTIVKPPATATAAVQTAEEGGYVKGMMTYMVMDDLVVKPMSTISSITLLSTFNVKDLGALEEKMVYLGKEQALKLLKVSLQSQNVLTTVFLGKKLG